MFIRWNEKGSAIVVVLFVIVIFSIIGLSVTNLTVSNAKQVQIVEEDMQAVDVAEMGVVFYRNAIIFQVNNVLDSKINNAINNIINKNKNATINETSVLNELNSILNLNELKPTDIQLNVPLSLEFDSRYSYKIDNYNVYRDPANQNKLIITFNSNGKSLKDTANLLTTINLDLPTLIKVYLGGPGNSPIKSTILTKPSLPLKKFEGTIENEKTYKTDISNYKSDINNITAVIEGHLSMNNGNRSKSNSFLYVTGNADLGNTQQNPIEKFQLFVGGNLNFHNTKAGIKESVIYVVGNMEFHNQIGDIIDTKICVQGNIITKKNNFPTATVAWKENLYSCYYFGGVSGKNPIDSEIERQINKMFVQYK